MANLTAVGDVHRCWRQGDAAYLERRQPDLTMFVGDLGDEDVDMVRRVSDLSIEKAVILGNHDAWKSFSQKEATEDLSDSLAILGEDHIAYDVREVPSAGVSVIGARPFSWGGQSLRSPELYDDLYCVRTMRQSAAAIVDAARSAKHRDLVILAHNGPTGLGSASDDIYGKDFGKPGGDWGDYDLALALQRIAGLGLRVRAVIAGHMHHLLLHPRGGLRKRFIRRDGTMFINCAVVPRVQKDKATGSERSHFVRTSWRAGECVQVEEVYVDMHGDEIEAKPVRFVDLEGEMPVVDESEGREA
ncbi:MAG: TIGR04168 family protein [Planctomycetota bacterium]